MVEKLFDIFMKNLKNPKLYISVLILVVVFLLLFPYIDANFLYYNRVEKRISILKEIMELDKDKLKESPELEAEYQSILEEVSKQRDGSLGIVFGGIAARVPTIINPICNYILMPLLQLILIGILATSGKNNS